MTKASAKTRDLGKATPWLGGKHLVDLAPRVVEELGDLATLLVIAGGEHLADRMVELNQGPLEQHDLGVGTRLHLVPGRRSLALGDGLPAGVREREAALAVDLLARDQPLVLEQLEGGV